MAGEDDLVSRLIFESLGQAAIDAATLALDRNRNAIEYNQVAMKHAGDAQGVYQDRLRGLASANVQLARDLDGLRAAESAHAQMMMANARLAAEDAAATAQRSLALQNLVESANVAARTGPRFVSSMDEANRSTGRFGMGLLQLGYLADDAQYGLRGIQNNLPQLAMSFGLGAGLGGAIAITVTAVAQLTSHWQQLSDAFGLGATQTEAEKMDALAKATARTVDEEVRLANFRRQQAAGEAIVTGLPKAKEEEARKVQEALKEAGGAEITKGFVQLQLDQMGGAANVARQREAERDERQAGRGIWASLTDKESMVMGWEALSRTIGLDTAEDQAKRRAKQYQIDLEKSSKMDIGRTAYDSAWRDKMVAQIRAHPEYFPAGTLEKLQAVSPEALAAEQAAKAAKKPDAVAAKVQAALEKTERQAAQEAGRQGRLDLKSEPIRQFLAGTLPLSGLGGVEAATIRGGARDILGRERAGAVGDPKLLKAIEDQTKLMEAEARKPMAPPRPVAGARRAIGVGG